MGFAASQEDAAVQDLVNGLVFELLGSVFLWMNVRKLWHDRELKGVYWYSTAFWSLWGCWNLYYYPSLGQWWSFLGGLSVFAANTCWLVLALRYRAR